MYLPDNFVKVKRSDVFLFVLAIVILAALIITLIVRNIPPREHITRIVFTQWWVEDLEEKNLKENALTNLIREFENLHPGIRVALNYRSYEDLRRVLFIPPDNPENDAPPGGFLSSDITALDPLWIPELLKMGIIENPGPTLLSFINVLFYNIDILIEAGFSRPPRNRSELTNFARALTAGRRGLIMNLNSSRGIYDDVLPWFWAAGIELTRDGRPVLNSRPVIDSLSFLESLYTEGLVILDSENKLDDFIQGRAAFMIAPARYIRFVRNHMGDEAFGITSIPTPDNFAGRTFFASAGWTAGINSDSEFKHEARLFADFLTANASLLSREARAVPGCGLPPPVYDPFYSKAWEIKIAAEPSRDFYGLPWTEMDAAFREELFSLFAGNLTPAQAAAAIQRRWEDIGLVR